MKPAQPEGHKEGAPDAQKSAQSWRWSIPATLSEPNMNDFNAMYTIPMGTGNISFTPLEFPKITGINVGTGTTTNLVPVPVAKEKEYLKRIEDLEDQVRTQAAHILLLKARLGRVRQVLQQKRAANRISVATMEIEQALEQEEAD